MSEKTFEQRLADAVRLVSQEIDEQQYRCPFCGCDAHERGCELVALLREIRRRGGGQ